MDLLGFLGYAGAFLTGLVLGLLGGGGALLSIPVLVYFFKIEASLATGYSLFLVGVTALIGAFQNIRKQNVDYNAALYYGVPSVITVYATRRFLMPNLPKVFFTINGVTVDKNHFILGLLCIVMFMAAYKMINTQNTDAQPEVGKNHAKLALYAVLIGSFLGLVGAGGGFLMVPALIYFAGVQPKKAIGTSLLLVSTNSFIGFLGDLTAKIPIDYKFLGVFCIFSVSGVYLGIYLSHFIHNNKLKAWFGWFILAVAVLMVIKEIFFR